VHKGSPGEIFSAIVRESQVPPREGQAAYHRTIWRTVRIRTLVTTAAVSAALVAGGIAGPANAVDPVTVQPVITLPTLSGTVTATTASLPLTINTSTLDNVSVKYWLVTNGVPTEQFSFGYPDASGNVTGDLFAKMISSKDLPVGTYGIYFTTAAFTDYFSDPTPDVNYLAAQSPTLTLSVTPLTTKITGWKTKTKVAKYKKTIKVSSFTLRNVGPDATVVVQFKKKGAKSWKTYEKSTTFSGFPAVVPVKTKGINAFKSKFLKGTYYFRILVKATPYATGAVTKQVKVAWK